jgi:hypothetical protein
VSAVSILSVKTSNHGALVWHKPAGRHSSSHREVCQAILERGSCCADVQIVRALHRYNTLHILPLTRQQTRLTEAVVEMRGTEHIRPRIDRGDSSVVCHHSEAVEQHTAPEWVSLEKVKWWYMIRRCRTSERSASVDQHVYYVELGPSSHELQHVVQGSVVNA